MGDRKQPSPHPPPPLKRSGYQPHDVGRPPTPPRGGTAVRSVEDPMVQELEQRVARLERMVSERLGWTP